MLSFPDVLHKGQPEKELLIDPDTKYYNVQGKA
jgi:hypothetical protein